MSLFDIDRQTGVVAAHEEPQTLSFGFVGSHIESPPDLREMTRRLVGTVDRVRALGQDLGSGDPGHWSLLRSNPAATRTWTFADGMIDEQRWREALDGVPERFDKVWATALPRAEVRLDAPAVGIFFGSLTRSLSGFVRVPLDGVDESAEMMLEQLRQVSSVDGVKTGFVHLDSIADPYSRIVTEFSRLSDDDFSCQIHGYYWAVLLTATHIEMLGGFRQIVRTAPCFRVEELNMGDSPCLIATMTESPLEIDVERINAWRRFLAPILRPGFPGPREAVGVRAMPLQRPVWLLEGSTVPSTVVDILQHGETTGYPVAKVEWVKSSEQPDSFTCWLHTGPAFDSTTHLGLLNAIVNAWYVTGSVGHLADLGGYLHWWGGLTLDTDDGWQQRPMFQFDPGGCDAAKAMELLAHALSVVEVDAIGVDRERVLLALHVE